MDSTGACSGQRELCDSLVRRIACLALDDEPNPASRLLLLLSMCGVCQRWRQACRDVASGTSLAFDGLESAPPGRGVITRFRRTPAHKKTAAFEAAARLLRGYSDVCLAGECVTDAVLAALAAANGDCLTSLRAAPAGGVTDAGLAALFARAPRLRHVHLSDLGPRVEGAFLPALLGSCRQLQSLHIEGAPALSWAALDRLRASPGVAAGGDVHAAAAAQAAAAIAAAGPAGLGAAAEEQQLPQHGPGAPGRAAHARTASAEADERGSGPGSSSGSDSSSGSGSSTSGCAANPDRPWQPSLAALSITSDVRAPALWPPVSPHTDPERLLAPGPALAAPAASDPGDGDDAGSGGVAPQSDVGPSDSGGGGVPPMPPPSSRPSGTAFSAATAAAMSTAAAAPPPPPLRRAVAPSPPPPLPSLSRLHVRGARPDGLSRLLALLPGLSELALDGPVVNIQFAAFACPGLRWLSYLVESPPDLDDALWALAGLPRLRSLELVVKGPPVAPQQLRALGMLPLTELRLDSWAYKQQPTLSRPALSHVSNEGVKALVDAICARMADAKEALPLKLSLAGATAVNHEVVSALLRLPVLTDLDIAGCTRIGPMDKMRLVAKVKAGRERVRLRA